MEDVKTTLGGALLGSALSGFVPDREDVANPYSDEDDEFSQKNTARIIAQQKYESSGVPKKFYQESFDTFNGLPKVDLGGHIFEDPKTAVMKWTEEQRTKKTNSILLLYGNFGSGKTHLACGLIRSLGFGLYRTSFQLSLEYESCIGYHAKRTRLEMLEDYSTRSLLVIDEIGRGLKSDLEKEVLNYLICSRYENNLPTVLSTNMSKDELCKNLGMAVTDRLNEACVSVLFAFKSQRGNK